MKAYAMTLSKSFTVYQSETQDVISEGLIGRTVRRGDVSIASADKC